MPRFVHFRLRMEGIRTGTLITAQYAPMVYLANVKVVIGFDRRKVILDDSYGLVGAGSTEVEESVEDDAHKGEGKDLSDTRMVDEKLCHVERQ
mmetsp:Transcript_23845/g.36285  ORF Transcript_23845/g.36285 Transcript_23845/m.36285 type:complete len:93 (-) Transcript_23845:276-554(-)